MTTKKPTKELIEARASQLSDVWKDAHDAWEKIDLYYHQKNKLWPNNVKRPELHPARATAIIDHAVDNFLSGEPRVHRRPTGQGKKHQEKADAIEPWIQQILVQTALLEPVPTWKQVAKNMAMYGYAVVEGAVLSMTDRPEEPIKEKGEEKEDFKARQSLFENENRTWMPFRLRAPHPARVLLDPMEKDPREAIRQVKHYAVRLHEITEGKKDKGLSGVQIFEIKNNPYALVDCIEYWNKEYHALMADSKLLFVEKNTWGFVPFSHAFAGWGQESTNSKEPNPADLAKGLLTPLLDDLKAQAQAFSGRHNALVEASFQKWGYTGDPAEIAEAMKRSDMIGNIKETDLWKLDIPQLAPWMFESEALVDRDIEGGSFSRALSGTRETGVSTVGQQAILSTAAQKKFVTPSRQIEHMATIAASRILRLLDVLNERIQIGEYTIGPKDIDHDYNIDVKFELVDPVLQLEQRQMGMQEVAAKLKSKQTYMANDAKIEDVTGEKRRMLEELVEESPEVVALMAKDVAKRSGILDLIESLQEEEQGQSGLVDPSGNPISSLVGGNETPGAAARQLRQPLTGQAVKPPRVTNPGAI